MRDARAVRSRRPMRTFGSRVVVDLSLTALVSMVAGLTGAAWFDSTCSADPEATDCDLGALYFVEWAVMAIVACAVASVVNEARLADRRARERRRSGAS